VEDRHLITVDELRAAGALDVPAAWRKSLGPEERDLFSDLPDEDDQGPEPVGCPPGTDPGPLTSRGPVLVEQPTRWPNRTGREWR
jgi:hypothetical protein